MNDLRPMLLATALLLSACAGVKPEAETAILVRPQLVPLRLVVAANPEWAPQQQALADPAIGPNIFLPEEAGGRLPMIASANADRYCLAEAIYFEARNEPLEAQRAVAAAVLNRVQDPQFPPTVCGVVHQPAAAGCQFSWYCDDRSNMPTEGRAWALAERLADAMLAGPYRDDTGGAIYFHSGEGYPSSWDGGLRQTAEFGQFKFYR